VCLLALDLEVAMVLADHAHNESIHPKPGEDVDQRTLPLRVVLRAGGEHRAAVSRGHDLYRSVDRGSEGVVDGAEKQPERPRPAVPSAQRPGALVRLEVQRHDGFAHPLTHSRRYVGLIVHDPGDRLGAHASERSHITDGRP
jgi:hypothetical protein